MRQWSRLSRTVRTTAICSPSAYIQKVRETTDFSYLDRANSIVDTVLTEDGNEYEALRLKLEIELERHNFKKVAELAGRMTKSGPE